MSLYDMIMGSCKDEFTKADWAALGRGDLSDQEMIETMLAQGYEGLVED